MKKHFFLLLVHFLFATGFSQEKKLPAIFYKNGPGVNTTMKLTLHVDSTFIEYTIGISSVDRSIATNTITGTYRVDKNTLVLIPQKLSYQDFKGNYTQIDDTKSILKSHSFIAKYEIIPYNNTVLLLHDNASLDFKNDFLTIINLLNAQDGKIQLSRYGQVWKNSESTIEIDKDISKNFPSPWSEYILKNPVKGKVISNTTVNERDKIPYKYATRIYTLNIGSKADLKKGMKLYCLPTGSNSFSMEIFEVKENWCRGYIVPSFYEEKCTINSEYSTKIY